MNLPHLLLPLDFKNQVTLCVLGAEVNKALPSQDGSLIGLALWGVSAQVCGLRSFLQRFPPGHKGHPFVLGQSCPSLFRTMAAEGQSGPHLQAVTLEQICFKAAGSSKGPHRRRLQLGAHFRPEAAEQPGSCACENQRHARKGPRPGASAQASGLSSAPGKGHATPAGDRFSRGVFPSGMRGRRRRGPLGLPTSGRAVLCQRPR